MESVRGTRAPFPIVETTTVRKNRSEATYGEWFFITSSDRSCQVWGHTPEQRVAASTLRRYSGLRLAIAKADGSPAMPASFR